MSTPQAFPPGAVPAPPPRPARAWRWIVAVAAGLVVVAGIAVAVLVLRPGPADAVDDYLRALDEGDIALLKESSCRQMSEGLDKRTVDAIERQATEYTATWKILKEQPVEDYEVAAYDVEVELTTIYTDVEPQTDIEVFRVVDEDGAWRVCL